MPSITKLDTLGNPVWSTVTSDTSIYTSGRASVHRLMLSGDYLYAICTIFQGSDRQRELWKVDATNGTIVWKKPFYDPKHIVDVDATRFLVGYNSDYNGLTYRVNMAFIDKETGETLSTHHLGDLEWTRSNFGLAVDSEKNIYYSKHDSIFKVNSTSPEDIIWKVQHPSAEVLDFNRIHCDVYDSLYLFGRKGGRGRASGKVVAVGKNDGRLRWSVSALTQDAMLSDMADKNGFLYATWRHSLVGGGIEGFWTTKVDKLTGEVAWNSSYNFTGVGSRSSSRHHEDSEGALSLDVDNKGDIYLTGYYGDANYGPACWGILKLDGTTGESIYEKTITEDPTNYDNVSVGKAACVINNRPYFIGELQNYSANFSSGSRTTFVKLEGESGDILLEKYIGGRYQFPSKTISIQPYGKDRIVALEQVGRSLRVVMYDADRKLLWKKSFTKDFVLIGGHLAVSDNGTIAFTGYNTPENSAYPYHSSRTDSIYLATIDGSGSTVEEHRFYVGSDQAYPTEIIHENNRVFIFYQRYQNVYLRKVEGGSLSSELRLGIEYQPLASQTKYAINQTDSTILAFGYDGSTNRVIQVDKRKLTTRRLAKIPLIQKINYVLKHDAHGVLLGGQDASNHDILVNYNTLLLDTTWTATYASSAEIHKFVLDPTSSFLYSVGVQSTNTVLRKVAVLSGKESWSHIYGDKNALSTLLTDITFNKLTDQLTITGYQKGHGPVTNSVIIQTIDTTGAIVDKYVKPGDKKDDNLGLSAQALSNGNVWVGGSLYQSSYGRAGFLFQIKPKSLSSSSFVTTTACNRYVSPSGKYTWTASKTYLDTISNVLGYDSIITVNLTINKVDTSTTVVGHTISANQQGATYQWLNCDDSYAAIAGETKQSFTANNNGTYAVEISQNGCVDTSACISMIVLAANEDKLSKGIIVYPNPTDGTINVSMDEHHEKTQVEVMDVAGKVIGRYFSANGRVELDLGSKQGVYFVKVFLPKEQTVFKIIKR